MNDRYITGDVVPTFDSDANHKEKVDADLTFFIAEEDLPKVQDLKKRLKSAIKYAPSPAMDDIEEPSEIEDEMDPNELKKVEFMKKMRQRNPGDTSPVTFPELDDGSSEVLIEQEDAHLYPWLVNEAFMLCSDGYPDIDRRVSEIVRRVFSRAELVRGIETVRYKVGLSFKRISVTTDPYGSITSETMAITPFVRFQGTVPSSVFSRIDHPFGTDSDEVIIANGYRRNGLN